MKTLKSVLQNIAGILQTVYSFFMLLGGGWIFLIFIERWTPEEALLFLFSLSSLGIGISSAILADSLIGGRKRPEEKSGAPKGPSNSLKKKLCRLEKKASRFKKKLSETKA